MLPLRAMVSSGAQSLRLYQEPEPTFQILTLTALNKAFEANYEKC